MTIETDLQAAIDANNHTLIAHLAAKLDQEDATRPAPPTLHAAALWYTEQGLHVFPLQPGTKIPFKGSNGCKGATTDPDLINKWWTGNPHANIGIATGHHVDVIDIDGPVGVKSWLQLLDDLPPVYGKVSTPRPGGTHLYVAAIPGRGNKASILPGVDYRGLGGYVVAPPSALDSRPGQHAGTYYWRTPLNMTGLHQVAAA